ncbi:unnamed protein product [Moneuplotes crassus]|uniref:Uncharacterized protein n=1 Tax=Euplotes crassus TaxID=5936 RepID=A0AAD1Y9V1_EUPCR|nr:unnamed protein product [Moneuplotes crassus]
MEKFGKFKLSYILPREKSQTNISKYNYGQMQSFPEILHEYVSTRYSNKIAKRRVSSKSDANISCGKTREPLTQRSQPRISSFFKSREKFSRSMTKVMEIWTECNKESSF